MADILEDIFWNSEIDYAYGLYKIIMKVMGVWPFSCHSIGVLLTAIFSCVTQIAMIAFIIGEAVVSNSAINLQMMSYLSCSFLCLSKVILLRINWSRMRYVLYKLLSAWKCVANAETLQKMKRHAELGRSLCMYQMGATYIVCLPGIMAALPIFLPVSNDTMNVTLTFRSLPLQTPHLFANISLEFYVIIFIYQCIQLFFTCTGNVGIDLCFFGIAMNLTAQLKCLAIDFENITENENESSTKKTWVSCIEKQVNLIEMAEYLERTFYFIILAIVCANCSQICFYGIVVLKSTKSMDAVLISNSIICMLILLLQIFLYSYAGDCLSQEIENLGNAAYKCSWHEMTVHDKRNIIFIIMRTRGIFSLTAGKIYRMDLDSFKNIVKAIGSYFSVMQAMFEE